MKKYLLVILSLQFVISANAQTNIYHQFPDSSANWYISWFDVMGCSATVVTLEDYTYSINGDSIVNGITYHKVYKTTTALNDTCGLYQGGFRLGGLIRQDIIQHRVYCIPVGSATDTVLYDFNLNTGDTVPNWYSNRLSFLGAPFIVGTIDSVFIGSDYRKRINMIPPQGINPVFLVEGIGSNHGLFEDLTIFEFGGTLNCFSQNNSISYSPNGSSCTVGIQEIKNGEIGFEIYPNPTTDFLKVKIENFKSERLFLYNVFGQLIEEISLADSESIVDVSNLTSGIYIVELSDEARTSRRKIIKQ